MQLNSVMVNLSWFCPFSNSEKTACPYCWVTQSENIRSRTNDIPVEKWLSAIKKHFSEEVIFDFVGGEPTAVPSFHNFLEELSGKYRWALTSNMGGDAWKEFDKRRILNGVSWTASYHHTSPDSIDEFIEKCKRLSVHYPVSVNLVNHQSYNVKDTFETLKKNGLRVFVSPYEDIKLLNEAGKFPLTCNGGQAHIVIDSEGWIYKCLSQQRRLDNKRWRIGNIFDDEINWTKKRAICFIPCDQFYILDKKHSTKDMWGLDVRELEISDGINLGKFRDSFKIK